MHYNKKIGQYGELLAKKHLAEKGYKIIDSNVQISHKEVDLIVGYKNKLIFVEVKTRMSQKYGRADETITDKKINNLKQAAERYLIKQKIINKNVRFDFISVDINRNKETANIKHYQDII